jgi:ammonia channel protein AmtB
VTTTLSAAAGGITNLLLERFGPSMWCDHTWSVGAACNGILAGLVSITAGCSVLLPGSAVIAGIVGTGVFYFLASKIVLNVCKIDDPLDAFAVHGSAGFFAVIFANTAAHPTYAYGAATKDTGVALGVATGSAAALLATEGVNPGVRCEARGAACASATFTSAVAARVVADASSNARRAFSARSPSRFADAALIADALEGFFEKCTTRVVPELNSPRPTRCASASRGSLHACDASSWAAARRAPSL